MNRRIMTHVIGYTTVVALGIASTAQALPNNSVDSADIIDGQVKRRDIADSAINTVKVADGSLFGVDLAADSVDSSKVADGSIAGVDLAPNAIDSSKVTDGSLTGADLGTNTITTTQIAESGLNLAFNCGGGMVKAHALIQNAATIPAEPTTDANWLWYPRSCAGGIDVERLGVGSYRVRLFANGATMVQLTPYGTTNNMVSVSNYGFFHEGDGGLQVFIAVRDVVSGNLEDGSFSLLGY